MIIATKNKQHRYAIISFIIAILLAALVKLNFVLPVALDNAIHNLFNQFQTPFGDVMMSIAAFLGNPIVDIVYALILAGVLIIAELRIPAIWTVLTLLFGNLFTTIIKIIVNRDRPIGHLLADNGPSFPSNHVFSLFVVIFIVVILVIPNINSPLTQLISRWLIVVIGLMTIMSRIYFNANFLSDTFAAVLLAYAWVILSASLYPKLATFLKSNITLFKHDEI